MTWRPRHRWPHVGAAWALAGALLALLVLLLTSFYLRLRHHVTASHFAETFGVGLAAQPLATTLLGAAARLLGGLVASCAGCCLRLRASCDEKRGGGGQAGA